jgi:hypothetical protein
MDTSVAIEGQYGLPERVMNLPLMEQRRTKLMIAGLAIPIGAIFTVLSYIQHSQPPLKGGSRNNSTRCCPFCAEEIKQAATICKHCQRDVPPGEVKPSEELQATEEDDNPLLFLGDAIQRLYQGEYGLKLTFWHYGGVLVVMYLVLLGIIGSYP